MTFNTTEDESCRVQPSELRQFVEQIEKVQAEKAELAELEKEHFASAKASGYDTKAIRKLIALRKRDKDDIAEEEAVLDLYMDALGM